jgi:hypothetical protein
VTADHRISGHRRLECAAGRVEESAASLLAVGNYISNMGLTGFDVSNAVRVCDPSCSDSLNGATTRIADEQFALAA